VNKSNSVIASPKEPIPCPDGMGSVAARQHDVLHPEMDSKMCNESLVQATSAHECASLSEAEHESVARKCRARKKRKVDSARKLRRSMRLQEKEGPNYEDPTAKATRVQAARFDLAGASKRLRTALSKSTLASDPSAPSDNIHALVDIANACGASTEELTLLSDEGAQPENG
jgi:phage I-like protein